MKAIERCGVSSICNAFAMHLHTYLKVHFNKGSSSSLSANYFEKPCKSMIYGAFFFATYKNTYKK